MTYLDKQMYMATVTVNGAVACVTGNDVTVMKSLHDVVWNYFV